MDDLERALLGVRGPNPPLRLARVKIAQASPLTVTLPGAAAAVPALALAGLTYTAGGNGVALIADGLIPVVLPTVT